METNTEQIWKEYHAGMKGFILSRVSDSATADDILQEVFSRIHSKIDSLRETGKIRSWVYQITRNAIIDYYRSKKPTKELPESLATHEKHPDDNARQEIGGWLIPMIQQLPEQYKSAVIMSEVEELSQKEIAKKLNLSLSGAKSRIQRGRTMMRKMLVDCCSFQFDRQGKVFDYKYQGKDKKCDKC